MVSTTVRDGAGSTRLATAPAATGPWPCGAVHVARRGRARFWHPDALCQTWLAALLAKPHAECVILVSLPLSLSLSLSFLI